MRKNILLILFISTFVIFVFNFLISSKTLADQTSTSNSISISQETITPAQTQVADLPSNIQPTTTPVATQNIFLTQNGTMKTSVLWMLYVIIPAILSGVAIFASIMWRKSLRQRPREKNLGKQALQV